MSVTDRTTSAAADRGDVGAGAEPSGAAQPAGRLSPMRTGLATVCISGTLEDKLTAAGDAGFDGVEIFEPDFVASSMTAAQVRDRCADLGLTIDLYQPFRDFDTTRAGGVEHNLRRLDRKFDIMAELGTDLILVCSAVSPDAVHHDDVLVEQLSRAAELAQRRGMRVSYEALAWGSYVNTYEHSWDLVRRVDAPALGLCLDSFHILSRGSDPAGIEGIPADKIFFLQLADAPHLTMDVLQWSRHHRLFPGQGAFDLVAFLRHVLAAGYRGPLSLEVFNDVFRQSDPQRSALDALRSLLVLQEQALPVPASGPSLPAVPELGGFAFVELAVDGPKVADVTRTLSALGLVNTGRHRSKPVDLWESGAARILVNQTPVPSGDPAGNAPHAGAAVAALGLETQDPGPAVRRADALLAQQLPRRRGPAEADLAAVAAPDGTEIFLCHTDDAPDDWRHDFPPVDGSASSGAPRGPEQGAITAVDHVALTQPFDRFDEASLFYGAILGLRTAHSSEIAAPFGLVRNRAVTDPDALVRICLSVSVLRRGAAWRPGVTDPQHVAFATDDVIALAEAAAAAGAPVLPIPDNYYDDLDARLALPAEQLADLRRLHVLFDRSADGDFLHFYTEVIGGRLFFEAVQRVGDYRAFGEVNSPIRMAAHRRQRGTTG